MHRRCHKACFSLPEVLVEDGFAPDKQYYGNNCQFLVGILKGFGDPPNKNGIGGTLSRNDAKHVFAPQNILTSFSTVASKIRTEPFPTELKNCINIYITDLVYSTSNSVSVSRWQSQQKSTNTEQKLFQKEFPICICICVSRRTE